MSDKEKVTPEEWNRERKWKEVRERRAHFARLDRYHERESQISNRKTNWVCLSCRKTAKLEDLEYPRVDYPDKCPHCGEMTLHKIGTRIRAPKKNASNKVWKNFEEKHYLT